MNKPVLLLLSGFVCAASVFGFKKVTIAPGDNITLSSSNSSKDETQVDWFRVENGTKARCIVSIYGSDGPSSFCSGFKDGRFGMRSNTSAVFLTIHKVNPFDSGLYFCGFFMKSNIVLGETTYLEVRGDTDVPNTTMKEELQTGIDFSWSFIAAVVLGCLSGLLSVAVAFLVMKNNRFQKANKDQEENNYEIESQELNYAEVNVRAAQRPQRSLRQMEPYVVYSSTR